MFLLLLRTLVAGSFLTPLAHLSSCIREVEGKLRTVMDIDVVDLLPEGSIVKFVDLHNLCTQIFEPVFSQAFDRTVFLVGASPVVKFSTSGGALRGLAEIAATIGTLDLCRKAAGSLWVGAVFPALG